MTATQTKPLNMTTRRPREQYLKGLSTWIGGQEEKVRRNESIYNPTIEGMVNELAILQKRLEHVRNGKIYTPPAPPKPALKAVQPKAPGAVITPRKDIKEAVEEVVSSQLKDAVREILEELLGKS